MIDTASFMLGNLQSIFLPTKTKILGKNIDWRLPCMKLVVSVIL